MEKIDRPLSNQSPMLFPILDARPSGLARLAAEAQPAGSGHRIEFKTLKARSLLHRSSSRRGLSFAYSINPYRGCEFGCKYCYARYTHEFLEPSRSDSTAGEPTPIATPHDAFEHSIYLKQNAPWLLEQELRKIAPGREIALGTATDPYQPVERATRLTRSILEVFARQRGHRLGIVTKSPLITRDIDLLTEIAAYNVLVLHLTITTPDASLARLLEPRAPRPDLRLEAVRSLREAGLTTGILCSPLLPGLTDSPAAIDVMASHARAANASFFAAEPLFLKPCSRPTYLNFLERHFPALLPDHVVRFASADFASAAYRTRLRAMVQAACRRHGLPQRSTYAILTRDTNDPAQPFDSRKSPASISCAQQRQLFA